MAYVLILDGAATINMLKPIGVKTFQDYATHVFLPFIKTQLRKVTRIDIIWDVYLEDSLKSNACTLAILDFYNVFFFWDNIYLDIIS